MLPRPFLPAMMRPSWVSLSRTVLQRQPVRTVQAHSIDNDRLPLRFSRGFSAARPRLDEKRPSFMSQLYESTQQRIQRERAEQERYSQYQTRSMGSRFMGTLFGMKPEPDEHPSRDS